MNRSVTGINGGLKKWWVLLFLLISMVGLSAFSGQGLARKTGHGMVAGAKGVGKALVWSAKGVYRLTELAVGEVFRPIRPLTNKMVDLWGVPVEE